MIRNRITVASIAALFCFLTASNVFAQEEEEGTMSFGEEEAEETMTFGEEEAKETNSGVESMKKKENPSVGVLAIPTEAIDSSQRSQLQTQLDKSMQQVPDIRLSGSAGLMSALQQRTIPTCVTEPLCLGSVGRKAGVDRIVMARVKENEGVYQLDIDYFNVEDKLFIKYKSVKDLGSFNDVVKNVDPAIKQVFEIRQEREDPDFAEENTGAARTIIAVSTAVLSAGSLAGGIIFGNQAAKIESDLNSHSKDDNGIYEELTQPEAKDMLSSAQGKAATANIFYGLSGAFAVASTVLFVIDPGGDVDKGAEKKSALLKNIDIKPVFSPSATGFSAQLKF